MKTSEDYSSYVISRAQDTEHVAGDNRALVEEIGQRLCNATVGGNGFDACAVAAIVDEAKQRGLIDEALTTKSIVSFCQAFGLGAHTLESVRPKGGGGGVATWNAVMENILQALGPGGSLDSESTA